MLPQTDSTFVADSVAAAHAADSLAIVVKTDSARNSFGLVYTHISARSNAEIVSITMPPSTGNFDKNASHEFRYHNELFKTHLLFKTSTYEHTNFKPTPDWFTFILLLVIISVTTLKRFYSKILAQLIKAFYNSNVANQVIRDENILVQRASVTLSIVSYSVIAMLIYQVSNFYEYNNPLIGEGLVRFLIIAVLVALAFAIKMIFLKLMGFIFRIDKFVASYIFHIFLSNNMLGLVLIPVIIFISYSNWQHVQYIYYLGFLIVFFAIFYRWVKGMALCLSHPNISLVYLIFYLCGLEIAPLLIIAKLISM